MVETFKTGIPVTTTESSIEVKNNLAPGIHTFSLVVVDEQGNRSAAATARVVVRKRTPNPVR